MPLNKSKLCTLVEKQVIKSMKMSHDLVSWLNQLGQSWVNEVGMRWEMDNFVGLQDSTVIVRGTLKTQDPT